MKFYVFCAVFLFSISTYAQKFPDISKPTAVGGGEKDAALVVAIEDYAFLPDVPGAEQNGTDWYKHFTKGMNIPATRVTFLRNQEATLEEMEDAIAKLAKAKTEGGKLWFVFIGHGAPDPKANDGGILIGVDAQQTAKSLEARSLPQSSLLDPLAAATSSNPGDAIVILDACFSGKSEEGALVPGLQPVLAIPKIQSSVVFLSAARNDEFAGPLPGAQRPAYSYLALGALRGWADSNGDKSVSVEELTDYVNDTMKVIVKGRTQTANRSSPVSNISLSGNAKENGPDWVEFVASQTKTIDKGGSNTGGNVSKSARPRKRYTGHGNAFFRFHNHPYANFTMSSNIDVTSDTFGSETGVKIDFENIPSNAVTMVGGQAEVLLGDRGFIFGLLGGIVLGDDFVDVRVSSTGTFVKPGEDLSSGVTGTVNDFTIIDIRTILGYRIGIGAFTISPRLEPGAQVLLFSAEFTLDGNLNQVSGTNLKFAMPATLGLGYDVTESVVAAVEASYFVFPGQQISLHAGVGFYF